MKKKLYNILFLWKKNREFISSQFSHMHCTHAFPDFAFDVSARLSGSTVITTRNISWIPMYQDLLRICRLSAIWRTIELLKLAKSQLSSCATIRFVSIRRNSLKTDRQGREKKKTNHRFSVGEAPITSEQRLATGSRKLVAPTCNRAPNAPGSFACTDLPSANRLAGSRDSARCVFANPTERFADRLPQSRRTAIDRAD